MKFTSTYFIKIVLLFAALIYFIALFNNLESLLNVVSTIISGLLIVLFLMIKKTNKLFLGIFLVGFFISELIYFFKDYNRSLVYYIGNMSCVIAYASLFIYVIYNISMKKLIKKFVFPTIVLSGLGIYLLYSLDKMLNYHEMNSIILIDYILETAYNFFVILVLMFSFLHYIYFMTKKAIVLFLACLFLCLSELTQVAYLYVTDEVLINIIYSLFLIVAFFFIYRYLTIKEVTSTELFETSNENN